MLAALLMGLAVTAQADYVPFIVRFDHNNGTGKYDEIRQTGYTYSLPGTIPSRPGYTFLGWFRGTEEITRSTPITTTVFHTCVAHWLPPVTVLFDAQCGSVSPVSKSVTTGKLYGSLPTPSRTGYTFDGWNSASDGSGIVITATSMVTETATHTLYAKWTPVVYTVTFDAQGGSVSPASTNVTWGQPYGTLPVPSRASYDFESWYLAPNGGGSNITASTTVTLPSAHKLYANWVTKNVTFDAQGGSVSSTNKSVTLGQPYGTLPTPNRTGYAFGGWYAAPNGGGTNITATTTVTAISARTLYAKWNPNVYTVTFNPQGGTVSPSSKQVTFNTVYGNLPTPTRASWYFAGWWTGAGGTGTRVKALTTYSMAGPVTLYAFWKSTPSYLSNPETLPSSATTLSTAYDGFVYDEDYAVQGMMTLSANAVVKRDKTGIVTTNWTFSAKVILQSATISFSGQQEGTADRFTATTKTLEKLDVFLLGDRFYGEVSDGKVGGTFFVDGAQNTFANKKDIAAQARLNGVRGVYNVALQTPVPPGPPNSTEGCLSLSVGNLGSVKIAGSLADGTKLVGSARLLEGLNGGGWYAIVLHRPLYAKNGFIGGLLWLNPTSKAIAVDTGYGWFVDWVREADPKKPTEPAFAYELDVLGGYFGTGQNTPLPPRGLKFVLGDSSLLEATDLPGLTGAWVTNALPWALDVRYDTTGLKLTLDKGIAPKIPKGETDYDYNVTNPSGATLTYTPKTGIFKGSFKTYFDGLDNKTGKPQHKVFTVPYTGLMVPDGGSLTGMGIGTATINKQKIPIPVYLTVW